MARRSFDIVKQSVKKDDIVELETIKHNIIEDKTTELERFEKTDEHEDISVKLKYVNRRDEKIKPAELETLEQSKNKDETVGQTRAKRNDGVEKITGLKRMIQSGNQNEPVDLKRQRHCDIHKIDEVKAVKSNDGRKETEELKWAKPNNAQNENSKLEDEQIAGRNAADDTGKETDDYNEENVKTINDLQDAIKERQKWENLNYRLIVGGIGQPTGYKLQDIVPRGDAPNPRPPAAPAPPPPDLLDQHNPEFLC